MFSFGYCPKFFTLFPPFKSNKIIITNINPITVLIIVLLGSLKCVKKSDVQKKRYKLPKFEGGGEFGQCPKENILLYRRCALMPTGFWTRHGKMGVSFLFCAEKKCQHNILLVTGGHCSCHNITTNFRFGLVALRNYSSRAVVMRNHLYLN